MTKEEKFESPPHDERTRTEARRIFGSTLVWIFFPNVSRRVEVFYKSEWKVIVINKNLSIMFCQQPKTLKAH